MTWSTKVLWVIPFLIIGCGGKTVSRATCNGCSTALTQEACTAAGNAAGCTTATLSSPTDTECNLGGPEQTHTRCNFTECNSTPQCGG